jgi:hypothetical protein
MMRYSRRTWLLTALLTALIAGLAASGFALAAKPSKPGGGGGGDQVTGTIWFFPGGTMNADGTNKQQPAWLGMPSYELHEGVRWLLSNRVNPDTDIDELVVVREDGDLNSTLYTGIPTESAFRARWAKDDSFISFSGGPTPDVMGSENGIYRAELVWDEAGVPWLLTSFVPVIAGTFTDSGVGELDPWFDWSPDGLSVVYVRWNSDFGFPTPLMRVTDFVTGNTKTLAITNSPMEWSPDGTRIAVHLEESSSSGIFTISPDGGGLVQVTSEGRSKNDFLPVWSPDSKYIAFGRQQTTTKRGLTTITGDVYRVSSEGGSAVNLTGDMQDRGTKWPNAWR